MRIILVFSFFYLSGTAFAQIQDTLFATPNFSERPAMVFGSFDEEGRFFGAYCSNTFSDIGLVEIDDSLSVVNQRLYNPKSSTLKWLAGMTTVKDRIALFYQDWGGDIAHVHLTLLNKKFGEESNILMMDTSSYKSQVAYTLEKVEVDKFLVTHSNIDTINNQSRVSTFSSSGANTLIYQHDTNILVNLFQKDKNVMLGLFTNHVNDSSNGLYAALLDSSFNVLLSIDIDSTRLRSDYVENSTSVNVLAYPDVRVADPFHFIDNDRIVQISDFEMDTTWFYTSGVVRKESSGIRVATYFKGELDTEQVFIHSDSIIRLAYHSFTALDDGSFLILAYVGGDRRRTYRFPVTTKYRLYKFSSKVELLWQKTIKLDEEYYFYPTDISVSKSGTIAVIGSGFNYNGAVNDIRAHFLFLDSTGNHIGKHSAVIEMQHQSLAVFPNPSANKVYFPINFYNEEHINVYDSMGKKVQESTLYSTQNYLDISGLKAGAYHFSIGTYPRSSTEFFYGQFVKQ